MSKGKHLTMAEKQAVAERLIREEPKIQLKEILPEEMLPKKLVPPCGIEAYQMCREGTYWSIWKFTTLLDGAISAEKIMDKEIYDVAKLRVGIETINAQNRSVK